MNTIPLTFAFIAAFLNAKNENGPVAKAWRLGRNQLVRSRSRSALKALHKVAERPPPPDASLRPPQ